VTRSCAFVFLGIVEKLIYAFKRIVDFNKISERRRVFQTLCGKLLGAPHARSSSARELPSKPASKTYVPVGLAALTVSYSILWISFPFFLIEAMSSLLSAAQVSVTKTFSSGVPSLIVKLVDGSSLALPLTWQRCGIVSITVFGLLFLLLMYPLQGPFLLKVAWLEIGILMGLTWSLIRLSIAVMISYHFGASVFTITEFLTGPLTDIFWMVAVWSLMLSSLASRKRC